MTFHLFIQSLLLAVGVLGRSASSLPVTTRSRQLVVQLGTDGPRSQYNHRLYFIIIDYYIQYIYSMVQPMNTCINWYHRGRSRTCYPLPGRSLSSSYNRGQFKPIGVNMRPFCLRIYRVYCFKSRYIKFFWVCELLW